MPGNAAAEGGYGLGANEAFGGQVGSGNVSPSAVGGTFGGFGPSMGSAADNPAQAGRFGVMGTPNANATFASVQALADRGRAMAAANAAANAAARGMRGKAASNMGVGSIVSAQQAVNATVDAFGTISPSAISAIAEDTGVSPQAVSAMAAQAVAQQDAKAIGMQVDVDAAMNRGGLQSGNFGPGLLGGTVSSADLASGNTETVSTGRGGSITSAPGSLESMSFGVPEGMLSAAVSQAQTAPMSVDIPAMVPSVTPAPAPAMVTPTQTNVTPAQVAQSMMPATTPAKSNSIFGRNQSLPAYNDRGLLGKIGMDLAMGLSINPFASREDQAASLASRGYSQADIDGYFARTDANIAQGKIDQENSIGAGLNYITDQQLSDFAATMTADERQSFLGLSRAAQVDKYRNTFGY